MLVNKLVGTVLILILTHTLLGCSTEGKHGMIVKSSVDVSSLLQSGQAYEEQGFVKGRACHYHVFLIPFGNSNISEAVEQALDGKGAEALLGVTTSKWYAGIPFVLIPSLFDIACTTVTGTAIRFLQLGSISK